MTHWRALLPTRRWLRAIDLRQLAIALLIAWFIGLLVATVQLESWNTQLTRTLVQLNADSQFRARFSSREQLDAQWYRRKAVALLAAMEKHQHSRAWTVFIPGSWRVFDDLEERLSARMEREFGEIVLETIRRELFTRTGKLTGTPVSPANGTFRQPLQCAAPQPAPGTRIAGSEPQDQPEFIGLREYVASMQALDQAVAAWTRLQQNPGDAGVDSLRRLVRHTLDAELPGPVSRSVALFGAMSQQAGGEPQAMVTSLQTAARCGLLRGVEALHARLLAQNDLLAMEQALAERSAGLFDNRRTEPFAPTVQRYRAVHAVLQQQEALLGRGATGWMRQGALQLGPGYEALLEQAAGLSLLGPEVVQQARAHSAAAFAHFKNQTDKLLGQRGRTGLIWDEARGTFTMAPDRMAMRAALGLLLREPFMQVLDDGTVPPAPASFEEALAVTETRRRVRRDVLPRFPEYARASVGRTVDGRLVVLAHDAAANAIRASLPQDPRAVLDAATSRTQRQKVAQVQSMLVSMGAPDLAQRLGTQQAAELGSRLAQVEEELKTLPLLAPGAVDFSWWRGEPGALLRAAGVSDVGALQNQLMQQYRRLDALGRQAEQYVAAAGGPTANDPTVQRWQRILRELDRYRAQLPDSSMLAYERYLLTLGPYLRRENCLENLGAQRPPRHDDDVAVRHTQVHNALVQRCVQLRNEQALATMRN